MERIKELFRFWIAKMNYKHLRKRYGIPMTPKMQCLMEYCAKRAEGSEDTIDEYEKFITEIALQTGCDTQTAAAMCYIQFCVLGVEE